MGMNKKKAKGERNNKNSGARCRDEIRLGCVAYKCFMRPDKVLDIWEEAQIFFKRHGVSIQIVLFLDYEAQVDALVRGMIDIAWNTPLAYAQTKKILGKNCRIVGMRDTDRKNTSVLITYTDSSLRTVADFKKQDVTLALGSSDSLYANILPLYCLRQRGIGFSHDKKKSSGGIVEVTIFERDLGKHGDTGISEVEVIRAVVQRKVHAGALSRSNMESYEVHGIFDPKDVRIIWESPPFSHCNLTSRRDVPDGKIRAFQDALFKMKYSDPRDRIIMDLEGLRRWIPGNTKGYELVEKAATLYFEQTK
jgi:ABC-type phosphate/phosphonate transport system substrate-binding protein